MDYKKAGVDVELGDIASTFAGRMCRSTFENSKAIRVIDPSNGYFRGNRYVLRRPGYELFPGNTSVDGEGHKPIITDAARMHRMSGRNLVAMTGMDAVRNGELPTTLGVDLSVATLGKDENDPVYKAVCEIFAGIADACTLIDAVYYTGETAEIKRIITSDNPDALVKYNLTGSMESIVDPEKLITGNTVGETNQIWMALREKGYRSNGGSMIIAVAEKAFGPNFYSNPKAIDFIKAAAEPCVLYEKFFCHLNGWWDVPEKELIKVHLISHISGGSFEKKLGQDLIFPRGYSAYLTDLWDLPPIVEMCAEMGSLTDRVVYETFCAGNGVLALIDANDEQRFISLASKYDLEAKFAGESKKSDNPQIVINSKYKKGETLIFNK